MRILVVMLMILVMNSGRVVASTIDLTDGRVVQGDISRQDDKSVQVNVDGVLMTYYRDEIKDIDGKPLVRRQTSQAVAANVIQPAVSVTPAALSQPVLSTQATDGIDPEKRILILKFIDVFGTRRALIYNFQSMITQIAKEKPAEAEKIRDRVKVDEIIEHLLPIYDRNFSSDDLKAFIAFYGSAEGEKLLHTIPVLMKESVQESIKYMKEKFPEAAGT